ncbi:glycosyltransferase family 39 protein [Actinoplanes regularis]|uniref:Dolichyl-phosphate-mannose-protein mannosyltransferase n=1 Tax=Actinoplanes regularis TaxID=52697 RepID=A0A238YGP3_9ACTN|nr:glycosyltransferase family 39 protein [Actinoplanes regularis]GIE85937.1 membrane protein [Actinoplanes regularis]SNR69783.1 Dolichyl-phosphate-mannose-protein mannosyltransferase [Actinoplanes regularis]
MFDVVPARADRVEETPSEQADRSGPLSALRTAAPAIGLYVLLRLLSLEIMYMLAAQAHARAPGRQVYPDGSINNQWRSFTSATDALVSWDGRWYTKIAGSGLGGPVGAVDADGVPYELRLAFFPLYPWLARPLTFLPLVSPVTACLIVSLLSAIAAAWGLYAVGRRVGGHRVGVMLAAVWAVVPTAMTQNGAFTESLFTALAVWALYAVLTERWLIAGLLAGVSGLSRPTAAALIGTVGLAALIAAVSRRGGWRPYVAMLLAPAGLLAYLGFASARLGGFTRYTDLHHNTFGARWDHGANTWGMVSDILIGVDDDNAAKPIRVLSLVILAGFIVLLVLLAFRAPWQLTVFAAAMLVLATGTSTHISMIGRHLLPAFPVLLVPAALLARASNRDLTIVLGGLALLSGWYAGWLPFISGQAI